MTELEVSGIVMHQQPYFGGAAPPQWLVEESNKKKPFSNQNINLQSESGSYTVNTDQNGFFKISLPPGTYKAFTNNPNKVDFTIDVHQGRTLRNLEFFFVVSRPPGPLPP